MGSVVRVEEFSVAHNRIIRDAAFADRLNAACDGNMHVPDKNFGRLSWVRRQLHERFATDVSMETVRKWFAGETKPRPAKMRQIAALLDVDEAWLAMGVSNDLTPRERKVRNALADGAVNLVAGMIQMGGGHPAFPEADDRKAERKGIDLYAIIRGANYQIHVASAREVGPGEYKFAIPAAFEELLVIGLVSKGAFTYELIELTPEIIQKVGVSKGGYYDVAISAADGEYRTDEHLWPRITGFDRRI